ncbi:MAG: hypothetical protein L3J68_01165 [Thermoplasmata archaeon]|nr:hypothetical protein [Thermoplasmata archaeon]
MPWPDWIFVPVLILWVVVNFGFYPAYPSFILAVGTFRAHSNVIFPITWGCALLLFAYGLWLFHRRYALDLVRTVVYAIALSFAATSLFEILYQNVGIGAGVGNQSLEGQAINLSALLLALSSLRFWRLSRPFLMSAVLFLGGWLLWLAAGYPQIYNPSAGLASEGYAFNSVLKVGAFVVVALLVSFALPWIEERPPAEGKGPISEETPVAASTAESATRP